MARLNDPPVLAAESIDALKRRFIRQNRELARTNSNQSQRIRNLETEISRLLAENIAIREQAIQFAADAERWRSSGGLGKDVLTLKDRLTAKLVEVNSLVEELGALPVKSTRRSSVRRRQSGRAQDTVKSPNGRDWRNRQTLGGVLNADKEIQEGKLPAILEDKYYPRRTLETAELRLLVDGANVENKQDTESPDLGPPPVAHFEVNDPIIFDSQKSPKRVSGGIINDEETLNLPSNLETRRKRRTSSLLQDMSVLPDTETSEPTKVPSATPLLKSGAKRKLDLSQLEESNSSTVASDDFVFQRKIINIPNRPKPSRFTATQDRSREDIPRNEPPSARQSTTVVRNALAPKSTNSPTKRRVTALSEKKDEGDCPEPGPSPRKTTNTSQLPKGPKEKTTDFQNMSTAPPKTPGAALQEFLSPRSAVPTEPSARSQNVVRSEVAITNSVEDVLNGSIGRGSRRARSAISYAEPNLRDKMRRPDKKLVGAVEGLVKKELARDVSVEIVEDEHRSKAIDIKTEPAVLEEELNDKWRSLPPASSNSIKEEVLSPLGNKEARRPSTVFTTKAHKRTLSEVLAPRSLNPIAQPASDPDKVYALSVYDPPKSSPVADTRTKDDQLPSETLSTTAPLSGRLHNPRPNTSTISLTSAPPRIRRHSVQPQASNPSSTTTTSTKASSTPTLAPPTRPSSALSSRDTRDKAELTAATSTARLKRASSAHTLTTTLQNPVGNSRSRNQSQTQSQSQSQNRTNELNPPPSETNLDADPDINRDFEGITDSNDRVSTTANSRTIGTRRRSMMV